MMNQTAQTLAPYVTGFSAPIDPATAHIVEFYTQNGETWVVFDDNGYNEQPISLVRIVDGVVHMPDYYEPSEDCYTSYDVY